MLYRNSFVSLRSDGDGDGDGFIDHSIESHPNSSTSMMHVDALALATNAVIGQSVASTDWKQSSSSNSRSTRRMSLVFSPMFPPSSCIFEITSSMGVQGIYKEED